MTDWWDFVDRFDVLCEARYLLPEGGCLAIQGTDDEGRTHALNLVESFMGRMGLETLRIGSPARPSTARSALLEIWRSVVPMPTTGLAPWATAANLAIVDLIDKVEEAITNAGSRVILLEDIDLDEPLPSHVVRMWGELADATGCQIIASSLPHTDWGSAPDWRHVVLGPFTEEDVRLCLLTSPELARRTASEIEEAIGLVRLPSGGLASPSQVYAGLAAWSMS